jgi:hypothetical protein
MEEKTRKILGLIAGIIAPGVILQLAMLMMILTGGFSFFLALLLVILLPIIIHKYISTKFYVMGIAINLVTLLAGFLLLLGACAEGGGFEGSPHPGAGISFFMGALVAAVFALMLFIAPIRAIIKTNSEPQTEAVPQSQ